MEDFGWLIPVATLLVGYMLRGVEQRRERLQAWDAAKRELYGRYLIASEERWDAARDLRIFRQTVKQESEEMSDAEKKHIDEQFKPEVDEMKRRIKAADKDLRQLRAEMDIVSPTMVKSVGLILGFSVEDRSELTGTKPDEDSYRTWRRRFEEAARRDLGLDKRPIQKGRLLFNIPVYWSEPTPQIGRKDSVQTRPENDEEE